MDVRRTGGDRRELIRKGEERKDGSWKCRTKEAERRAEEGGKKREMVETQLRTLTRCSRKHNGVEGCKNRKVSIAE